MSRAGKRRRRQDRAAGLTAQGVRDLGNRPATKVGKLLEAGALDLCSRCGREAEACGCNSRRARA